MKFRNIGDVLLTTPMATALADLPQKPEVTYLVKKGTEEMLEGHPNIHEVLTFPRKHSEESFLSFAKRQLLFIKNLRNKHFDISINTTEGDRGIILGFLSNAKQRIGYLKPGDKWWRRKMLTYPHEWNKKRRHTVLRNLDLISHLAKPSSISVELFPSDNDFKIIHTLLKNNGWNGKQMLVHIHPVSRWFFKCWRDDYMAEIIDTIQKTMYAKVVVTCAPDKKEKTKLDRILKYCESTPINLGGQLTLKQTGALSKIASLFFGVDSAPMHMAAAVNTPSIALFGPSNAIEWRAWTNGETTMYSNTKKIHQVIHKDWSCVPCHQAGCNNSKESKCLEQLTPDEIKPILIRQMQLAKLYSQQKLQAVENSLVHSPF